MGLRRQANPAKTAGFTLIELLVVIFIVSIVTSVALLSISRNESKQIETFANELTQTLTLAQEQAMLQPNVLGLSFDDNQYYFSSLQQGHGEESDTWTALDDNMLGSHVIPPQVEISIELDGKKMVASSADEEEAKPQIIISTNGDLTPFTIYIGKRGDKPLYAVKGDADGNVTNTRLP